MSDAERRVVPDAERLGRLCVDLPDVRALARQGGWSAELAPILGGLRDGTLAVATAEERIHARLGLPLRPRGFAQLPGQDPVAPPPGAYTCPAGRCARFEHREPGGPLPECTLYGEPLAFG
ncbi:hypothetical protein [Streptomyces sp. NPDC015131]|uniref:hypothetical protein n=1 Tax=Streptomyces sp. NPDC015131 TaxID=3364941 RepID=UPI0036FEA93B